MPASPDAGDMATATEQKQGGVVEMLEYIKGLDIDPVKEPDMLWIAEEAFHAALPPGWSEHSDEQGNLYFHNAATAESTWVHPMDDIFREIADYQRQAVAQGGFWLVEDQITEQEENLRLELANWMELFDEHGEKFFYNRSTNESRFDDPRMTLYHCLYAKIKMVAKMKERLPHLAAAPRPPGLSKQDLDLRPQQDQDQDYLDDVTKMQAGFSGSPAGKHVKELEAEDVIEKGPQPLRGQLRLRIERTDGGDQELVLSQTTPHRKDRAAKKIQARSRGVLARKHYRPLVQHRTHLNRVATKIQSWARVWLAKRRVERLHVERAHSAATNMQRTFRGFKDRQYISSLRAEKVRFEWVMKCVVKMQSAFRMWAARKRVKRLRSERKSNSLALLQKQARSFSAKRQLTDLRVAAEPLQVRFQCNNDPKARNLQPWTWQVWAAPSMGGNGSGGSSSSAPWVNLFANSVQDIVEDNAATKCQAGARGMSSRKRVRGLRELGEEMFELVLEEVFNVIDAKKNGNGPVPQGNTAPNSKGKASASVRPSSREKGERTKRESEILKEEEARKISERMRKEKEEESARKAHLDQNASRIQANWRGKFAREHVKQLSEEALWPMKAWFEYTATGQEAVQVDVRFVANPGFDDFKHFLENGSAKALNESVEDMEADILARVGKDDPWRLDPADQAGLHPKPSSTAAEEKKAPPERRALASPPGSEAQSRDADVGREAKAKKPEPRKAEVQSSDAEQPEAKKPAEAKKAAEDLAKPAEAQAQKPDAKKGEQQNSEAKASKRPSPKGSARAGQGQGQSPQSASAASAGQVKQGGQGKNIESSSKPSPAKAAPVSRDLPLGDAALGGSGESTDVGKVSGATAKRTGLSDGESGNESEVTMLAPSRELKGSSPHQRSRAAARPQEQPSAMSRFLAEEREGQFAHKFLTRSAVLYEDRAPPRGPEDKAPSQAPSPPQTRPPPHPSPPPPARKSPTASQVETVQSYAGVRMGNHFKRTPFTKVDDFDKAQKEAILNDMQKTREEKERVLEAKKQVHARRKQEELAKNEEKKAARNDFDASESERREKKVEDMKKWLSAKDKAARAKKTKDDEVFQAFMEKEREKSEIANKAEEAMQEQRNRRLRIAERQRAKLEAQQAAARAAGGLGSHLTSTSSAPTLGGSMLSAAQGGSQESFSKVSIQAPQQGTQRIIHRHIHHHVHYHEGGEPSEGGDPESSEGGGVNSNGPAALANPEAQRQLELASEERVRQQLEQQMQQAQMSHSASMGQVGSRILPPVEGTGDPRRPLSMGASMDNSKMSRGHSEGFLPQVDLQDSGRKYGLVAYPRQLERAIGAYADSGKPQRRKVH